MEFNLKEGLEAKVENIVEEKDTAVKFGSGNVYVYATPMMVGLMENAAMQSVDSELPEGYATVGIDVNIKHLAATPMGMKVYARASLTKVEGKKLSFKVEAFDEKKKIGEGTHTRYIIHLERFMEKLS